MLDYEQLREYFMSGKAGVICKTEDEAVRLLTVLEDLFPDRIADTVCNSRRTEWRSHREKTVYSLDYGDREDKVCFADIDYHERYFWKLRDFSEFDITESSEMDEVSVSDFDALFGV